MKKTRLNIEHCQNVVLLHTPKDQYRVFNEYDTVKNRCFHEKKNHQIENFIQVQTRAEGPRRDVE